jgi:hypothetical protein
VTRALVALVVAAALAALPPAASAQTALLEPADATELAQTLAEAQEEQDVCYGWDVSGDVVSVGSSTDGPDRPLVLPDPGCPRGGVILRAAVVYECSSCDGGDQAEVRIESTLASPPEVSELRGLGWEPGDLTGDKDDQALIEMAGALPLLVAEHGQAPFVEYEQAPATEVAATDTPTNSPGSDRLRSAAPAAAFGLLLMAAGLVWFFYNRAQFRATR